MSRSARRSASSKRPWMLVVWAVAFIVIGGALVYRSKATTPTSVVEAGQGVIMGQAQFVSDVSSGTATETVKFTGPPTPIDGPTDLHAFTGGDNVALRWTPTTAIATSAIGYNIFRDGVEIGSVDINTAPSRYYETQGTSYIDYTISPGSHYTYQVRAELPNTAYSAKSAAISVTVPTTTAPVPTITVNYNGLTSAAVQTVVDEAVTALRVWYPKAVNMLAGTAYGTTTSLIISMQDHTKFSTAYCDGAAGWVIGGSGANGITLNLCDSLTGNIGYAYYVAVHESTHIIQGYVFSNQSKMLTEGLADWMADQSLGVVRAIPAPPEMYNDGYEPAASFFSWILKNYNVPSLLKDMNVAGHQNVTDPLAIMKQETGKTVGQLWTKMTGSYESSLGPLKGVSTCAKPASGSEGALLTTFGCGTQPYYQNVVYIANPAKPTVGLIKYGFPMTGWSCIGTKDRATKYASYVVLMACDLNDNTQLWQAQADGTLKNVGAGYCLQPSGGVITDNTNLIVGYCTDASTTPTRRWSVPGA